MKTVLASVCCLAMGLAAASPGTNGAGETRTWNPTTGASIKGAFVSVKDGVVTIREIDTHTVRVLDTFKKTTLSSQNYLGQRAHETVLVPKMKSEKVTDTEVVHFQLGKLSLEDRRWVEEKNAAACCLKHELHKGSVGTLSPTFGEFRVTKIIDNENALIKYVVDGDTKWQFWLRSAHVATLKDGAVLKSIPDRPAVGDFIVSGHKTVENALENVVYDVVEDNH
jgi:hypothetical protein